MYPIKRIMIDMETANTGEAAPILTMGACNFGLPNGTFRWLFYQRASLESNENHNRRASTETLKWWHDQDSIQREECFGGQQDIKELLLKFEESVRNTFGDPKEIQLWSRGAGFDCNILQHAYTNILGYYPFDFRKHMCQRTLQELMPPELVKAVPMNTRKHHALSDAIYQADVCDVGLRNLSWIGANRNV